MTFCHWREWHAERKTNDCNVCWIFSSLSDVSKLAAILFFKKGRQKYSNSSLYCVSMRRKAILFIWPFILLIKLSRPLMAHLTFSIFILCWRDHNYVQYLICLQYKGILCTSCVYKVWPFLSRFWSLGRAFLAQQYTQNPEIQSLVRYILKWRIEVIEKYNVNHSFQSKLRVNHICKQSGALYLL